MALSSNINIIRLLGLLVVSSTSAALTTTPSAKEQDKPKLQVHHVASTTTSITVSWNDSIEVTDSTDVYHVEALSLTTEVRLTGPALDSNATQYEMPDLAVDAPYDVCVHASHHTTPACVVLSTIPVVRDDSLIVLFIVLAIVLAAILVAIILWRCAIRRSAVAAESETPSRGEKVGNADDERQNEKSPLLVAATAEPTATAPPTTDQSPPDTSNPEQPKSLYLFLAGHAFK